LIIYKVVLAYDGTNYFGWQKQPNVVSIQQSFEECIKKSFKMKNVKTMGSGRTDAGVHARGQVVKLEIEVDIEPENLKKALNQNLPKDIQVRSIEKTDDFHPTMDSKSKTYRYYFSDYDFYPQDGRGVLKVSESLDIDKMKQAAKLFIGEHSFHNYFCVGTPVKSHIRNITQCEMKSTKLMTLYGEEVGVYFLEISGNGFLKQMVRLIFGALSAVGEGKLEPEMITKSLGLEHDGKLAKVAPAKGLTLFQVTY
jgi:tRNA pseudouridine38-40 synthase